jgi:hypothetical protein
MFGSNEKIAKVKFTGDASNLQKETDKASDSLLGFSKNAVAVGAVLTAMGASVVKSLKAFGEKDVVQRKLQATLKATSSQAGITQKDINSLATELQRTTKFGDEALVELQTSLLKFGNVKKDVFEPTTRAIVDMASALGRDLTSTADMVGRALEDPIQGLTMLRRSGVSFTETQQEMIKKLVDSNKLYEAQGIILGELDKRFGGVAQSMAGGTGVFRQIAEDIGDLWEDMGEQIFNGIQPILIGLRDFIRFIKESGVVSRVFGGLMQGITAILKVNFQVLSFLVGKIIEFRNYIKENIPILGHFLKAVDKIVGVFERLGKGLFSSIGLTGELNVMLYEMSDWFNSQGNKILAFWENLKAQIYGAISAMNVLDKNQKAMFDRMSREATDRAVLLGFEAKTGGQAQGVRRDLERRAEIRASQKEAGESILFGEETARQVIKGGGTGGEIAKDKDDLATLLQQNPDVLLTDEQKTAYLDFLQSQNEEELSALQKQQMRKLEMEQDFRDKMNSTIGGALTQLTADESLSYKKREQMAEIFNNSLLTLAKGFGEKNKNVMKAYNIAQAVMNSKLAFTKTLASFPYPINIPLAGLVLGQGMMQVRDIAGAREGTIVGGIDTGVDNRMMRVRSGEAIIPPQYVSGVMPKLAQLVKEEEKTGRIGGGGGNDVRVMIEMKGDVGEFINAKLIESRQAGVII